VETITGGAGDDIINALAANPLTNAAQTTINSGDVIDGGAGNDTLNITMTAANNTSLTGLTVSNVETVNITGANNQNTAVTALAAAQASKATTAATLTARNAEALLAAQQDAAADEAALLAATTAGAASNITRVGELATDFARSADATTAPQLFNAAKFVGDLTAGGVEAAAIATSLPAGVTGFTLAQYTAMASAAMRGADGVAFATGSADITARADAILNAAYEVWVAVGAAASSSDAVEVQLSAAATGVRNIVNGAADDLAAAAAVEAAINISAEAFALLNITAYTRAQYVAAATAVKTGHTGATLTTKAALLDRATDLNNFRADVANVAGDYTLTQLNTAAAAVRSSAAGSSLITPVDDQTALVARAGDLATLSQSVLTAANTAASTALTADTAAANALSVATTNAVGATASISGSSQFAGATQVWLVGAGSNRTNLTVSATQTAGLDAVTGLSNTINFGATGSLAVKGSDGAITVTGAASGLSISGTGTTATGLTLSQAGTVTATTGVKTLNVNTTGASVIDASGMPQLTTVNIGDVGAVTFKGTNKVASITSTGTGADTVRINTATIPDDLTTPSVNETVNAVASTGAGNDLVNVSTTGTGTTTITTGAGTDRVYVQTLSTGVTSIDTGDDNDNVHLNVSLGDRPNLTINAGAGTDTLHIAGSVAPFTSVDYARMNAALSGFEAVNFTTAVAGVDVSKLNIGTLTGFTFTSGANVITEVGAGTTLTIAARATDNTPSDFVPSLGASTFTSLNATAAGYVVGGTNGSTATAYGGALTVSNAGNILILKGSSATVGVTASSTVAPTATMGGTNPASDLQSLTVNLSSTRKTDGTGSMATFNAGTITNTLTPASFGEHLEGLTSLKVNGSGVFTINTSGVNDPTLVRLTTIDLSGMTALSTINPDTGAVVTPNVSTSTVTLNGNAAETVILGGARDTVNATTSTFARMDTITGFQLTANATTPTLVDANRSDVLNVGTTVFAKFTTTASTLIGALTDAGASSTARLVFQFGGDTYVYVDLQTGGTSIAGLDEGDTLVKLTGNYDLDLLIQAPGLI
jgi:hypothetical protein